MSEAGRGSVIVERALWLGLLLPFFFGGYFAVGVGVGVDPDGARTLRTPLDDAIPFVAEAIFVYAVVYTALLLPFFLVRCPRLFRRSALAYAAAIAISLLCFAAFPVTSVGLRPDLDATAPMPFAIWGVKLLYTLDPPTNLFPSVHLAIPMLAALAAWEARRLYGAIALALCGPIAVSICVVKQHYAVDGLAGLGLAIVTWAALIRPARGSYSEPAAWGWRGPAGYVLFLACSYAAAWVVYRAGFAPWLSPASS